MRRAAFSKSISARSKVCAIFVAAFVATGRPLTALVCNAATYQPLLKTPVRSPEGL